MKKISFQDLVKIWNTKWLFGAIVAFFAAIFAILLANLSQFESLELKSYNARFAIRGEMDAKQDSIVVVAIDDQTFIGLRIGWPFPRALYAKAILNLVGAGARLIIIDVQLTEPQRDETQDVLLAAAIKRAGNVILAGKMVTEFALNDTKNTYLLPPLSRFLEAGADWGLTNVDEDTDGFIRRYLLFQELNGQYYYPLSMKAYLALQNSTNGSLQMTPDEDGDLVMGDLRVPKVDYNSMLINFRGPAKTFPTYSLSSVLDDAGFDLHADEDTDIFELHKLEGTFKNKIVFIGASAAELQDNKFTPFFSYKGIKRKMPGVELHANALSTLLRGDFISKQSGLVLILVVFFLSALAMLVTKWMKPIRGMFVVLAIIVFYFIFAVYVFINHSLWVEVTAPSLAIVLSFVGNVVHQLLTEQRERTRVIKSWQHFMSKDVIDTMLDSGQLPTFGGERRELSILFSDIRGFTTFTEKHASHDVVKKLNEYLTEMVDVIFKNNGTLDKFVGDEIMAVYGAPYPFKEHAEKACITALEMIGRLRALQRKWSENKEEFFQIGIGINSGKVILGNLGSSQLFDYTVIGDDVNLAARLEGANKQYGSAIIISEFTYKAVQQVAKVRELDSVRVKGKKQPVRIYELRGMGQLPSIEQDLIIDVYTQGLEHYKNFRWYQALTEFKRVLRYFPTDGASRVYIKRCLDFIEDPPPEDWDGVYEFTTK